MYYIEAAILGSLEAKKLCSSLPNQCFHFIPKFTLAVKRFSLLSVKENILWTLHTLRPRWQLSGTNIHPLAVNICFQKLHDFVYTTCNSLFNLLEVSAYS